MKLIILLLACVAVAFSQEGPIVSLSEGPPVYPYQLVLGYTGTNLIYVCYARTISTTGFRAATQVSITAASNASPVSFTSTGHGFNASSRPKVTISGATGNWTPINGTFTATITGANTFTIPVDSTTFGALTGTIVFTTTAPRTTVAEWAVQQFAYDGSNNVISKVWLNGSTGLSAKCSDATNSATNIQ